MALNGSMGFDCSGWCMHRRRMSDVCALESTFFILTFHFSTRLSISHGLLCAYRIREVSLFNVKDTWNEAVDVVARLS